MINFMIWVGYSFLFIVCMSIIVDGITNEFRRLRSSVSTMLDFTARLMRNELYHFHLYKVKSVEPYGKTKLIVQDGEVSLPLKCEEKEVALIHELARANPGFDVWVNAKVDEREFKVISIKSVHVKKREGER